MPDTPEKEQPTVAALSKNQQKRLLKQKKYAETKDSWKQYRKEKRKELKRRRRERGPVAEALPPKQSILNAEKSGYVYIDCSFDTLMTEKVLCII